MRKAILAAVALGLCLAFAGAAKAEKKQMADGALSRHMIAEATLTGHFIAAALKAGMSKEQINAVLARVAKASVISEFWISDAKGRIAFSNIKGADFRFPTDVKAKSQAAPFAALLSGAKKVVVQGVQPRAIDAAPFRYVGVAGVDGSRIVQVGVDGEK